jgi:DNA polymerase-1
MPDQPGLLLLFDGHALVHRAYHAMPALSVQKTGEPTGAVFGVASMLLRILSDYRPSYLAFAFDRAAPTFRHLEYADYKANRLPGDPDLRAQFPRVKELVSAFGIPIYEVDGYEADDLIGTLSKQARERGIPVIIVTGDQDTFQLVDEHVSVLTSRKGFTDTVLYDVAAIRERFGVEPWQIPDLKALVGDSSDNIKGVPGIGEKTAARLLQRYGTVEELLAHLEEVEPARVREQLAALREQILFSKRLATIARDAPVTLDLEAARVGRLDRERLTSLFRTLEFRTLLPRIHALAGENGKPTPQVQLTLFRPPSEPGHGADLRYRVVTTPAELEELVNRIAAARELVIDTETDRREVMLANLVGLALLPLPGEEAYYLPVGHRPPAAGSDRQLPLALVVERLRPLLEDPSRPKIAHHGKYDLIVLAEHGIALQGLQFDTMIAAYLLNERSLSLKDLAFSLLGLEMTAIEDLIGKGAQQITMAFVDVERAAAYAAADVIATARCRDVLAPRIEAEGLTTVFYTIELPLVPVLATMERCGIAIDTQLLGALSRELAAKIRELEQAVYQSVGHTFNLNSTAQLGAVLFEELKLPTVRRTRTGYSTDAQVLEELRGQHPVIEQILEYRQLTKLKTTYVDALPALINPRTGRIHTNFNQTVARTGRLSSSEPNLQNIPVRTPLGRRIRQAFIASRPDSVLLSADYSQIELRILAHITQDPALLAAFARGEDIHAATAAAIFRVPLEVVTPEQRRVAKTTNFGVIYGISDFGLAERTDLSRQEAAQFIRTYFETYPGIRDYIERTKEAARRGRVQTLTGRFQRFSEREILSATPSVRGAAERTAINMPIQGTAADIIKLAMVRLHQELTKRGVHCGLLLQVHDELLLEIEERRVEEIARLVCDVMEQAYELSVPLKVEVKVGKNWNEMTPLHV